MPTQAYIHAALLMSGEEILSGDILDTNSRFFSQQLKALGVKVRTVVTVGDEPEKLAAEIERLAAAYDLVIINGGIGPTVDDYTHQVLAQILQLPLEENQAAKAVLIEKLAERKRPLTSANIKQIVLPKGLTMVPNPLGMAPGVEVKLAKAWVFTTPGVPFELYAMFEREIKPRLQALFALKPAPTFILRTFGVGESDLQMWLDRYYQQELEGLYLGFRAHFPYVDIKLQALEQDSLSQQQFAERQEKAQHLIALLQKNLQAYALGTFLSGEPEWDFIPYIGQVFQHNNWRLSLAESITGGGFAARFTQLAGASHFFDSSVVVYSAEAKAQWLGLELDWIEENGTVSKATSTALALALQQKTKTDFALAITGWAGPAGERVGEVHYTWVDPKGRVFERELLLAGDRTRIQQLSLFAALDSLRRIILELDLNCAYSFDKKNSLQSLEKNGV